VIFASARTVALICLACTACSQDTPTDAPPPGRLPSSVIPVHYDISVEPDARALTFTGRALIDVDVKSPTDAITLNALNLEISSARLDRMGEAVVTLDYRGTIEKTTAGLFAVDYDTAAGFRAEVIARQLPTLEAWLRQMGEGAASKASAASHPS